MTDFGNELYAAWMLNIAGDVLAQHNVTNCEVTGDLLEGVMGFCKLITEWHASNVVDIGFNFITTQSAYQIWEYIENGIRDFSGYAQTEHGWMARVCPTALNKSNRDKRRAS